MDNNTCQVLDDRDLLELMLSDYLGAPGALSASARWLGYSEQFLDFLRKEGLKDFRSRRFPRGSGGAVLGSFGALDLNPNLDKHSPEALMNIAASCFKGKSAVDIAELPPSRVGCPEGFEVQGRFYTLSWLNFYCRYTYVSKFVDFDKQIIVELGPGSGKQAEMLKKAHPGLTMLLFDLPTQLYVCNQYLSKVFEESGDVVDYRAARDITRASQIEPGKIHIFPNWRFDLVLDAKIDLFWNAASLQEMATETAKAYLDHCRDVREMYLLHNIKFRPGQPHQGQRGVINSEQMAPFDEVDRCPATVALRPSQWIYHDSFWRNRTDQYSTLS